MMDPDFWSQLTEPLAGRLRALERRVLPKDLDALIEALCAWRTLGLRELAHALNRSPVYLQNTALKRLLKRGRLRFLHPDQPTHPQQAYRSTGAADATESPPPAAEAGLDIGRND